MSNSIRHTRSKKSFDQNYRYLIVVLLVLCYSSCSIFKPVNKTCKLDSFKRSDVSSKWVYEMVKKGQIEYNTISLKGKVTLTNIEGEGLSGTVLIRITKDSIIWASFNAIIGIEVMRVLVTNDSVKIIDRLQKKAYILSFVEATRRFPLLVEYSLLECTFTGNIPEFNMDNKLMTPDTVQINGVTGLRALFLYKDFKVDLAVVHVNNTAKVVNSTYYDLATQDGMEIVYDNIQFESGQCFPKNIRITQKSKPGEMIQIVYSKIGVDAPQNYPFKIPPEYEIVR